MAMNTPWARVARAEFDELQLVPDASHLVPVSISEPQLLRQALSSEDGPLRSRLIKKFFATATSDDAGADACRYHAIQLLQ